MIRPPWSFKHRTTHRFRSVVVSRSVKMTTMTTAATPMVVAADSGISVTRSETTSDSPLVETLRATTAPTMTTAKTTSMSPRTTIKMGHRTIEPHNAHLEVNVTMAKEQPNTMTIRPPFHIVVADVAAAMLN